MVVKLYKTTAPKRSAFREAATLALVELFGLPARTVHGVRQFGERWGIMMGCADGPSFADAVGRQPNLLPAYLKAMALLQLRVHRHPGTQFPSLKARLLANIQQATVLGEVRQHTLLNRLAALPERNCLCHGDFHLSNIMG